MSAKIIALIIFVIVVVMSAFTLLFGEKAQKVELDRSLIGTRALCVVVGDSFVIDEQTRVVKYKDQLYYTCCPGCDEQFIQNPEKYVNILHHEQTNRSEAREDPEVLYWTCTMHPEVRSDDEGSCPICGMNLTPVYGPGESSNILGLDDRGIELAGIRMVPVRRQQLHRELRLVGAVAYDPELVTAQEEYVNALEMSDMIGKAGVARERAVHLVESSEYKLRLLGMDHAEIRDLKRTRIVQRSLVIPDGHNWVYAAAYEPDVAWITRGQQATIVSKALPGREFKGRVESISPVVDENTRAATVRIRLDGFEPALTSGLYVDARLAVPLRARGTKGEEMVLAVPFEAVLDSGNRQVVWVYLGNGQFQPRIVKLGHQSIAHGDHTGTRYYQVIDGLAENEMIVTNGNFLIDSESSLTGAAAISYGGALGVQERDQMPADHQH
ncbi:efflux RND transporter periplasmic adaptor subunit [candidate division WOR-3 bacterium]|nr:efflux RND transporter periplasmic adaptor subunit [candidate division WOR-3 bacterium]